MTSAAPLRGKLSSPSTRIRAVQRATKRKTRPVKRGNSGSGLEAIDWFLAGGRREARGSFRFGLADGANDGRDRIVEGDAIGIDDDRIGGAPKRRGFTTRVDGVATLQVFEYSDRLGAVRCELALRGPPPRPLLDRGGEVDLHVGVGQDNRADVAAGHDDRAFSGDAAWASYQSRSQLRHLGVVRNDPVDGRKMHLVGHVEAARPDVAQAAAIVGCEFHFVGEGDEGLSLVRRDSPLARQPGHGAVEQPRVAKTVAEPAGGFRAYGALAAGPGAVESDHEAGGVAG